MKQKIPTIMTIVIIKAIITTTISTTTTLIMELEALGI